MPAICVMSAGNIVLGGSVAGMASSYRRLLLHEASSYRRPAPTLGPLVQEACSRKAKLFPANNHSVLKPSIL